MILARLLVALLVSSLGIGCTPQASEPIEILDAHAMSTPPGTGVGGAYLTIQSRDGDVLLGATTPVADRVEMHVTEQHDGMMSMRPLAEVTIAAGDRYEFAAGGAHFMLMNLRAPLAAGTSFPMTLRFKAAGDVTTNVRVLAPGEASKQ